MKLIAAPKYTKQNKYGSQHKNHVINLANVNCMIKTRMHWYPDNEGVPSIKFSFPNDVVEWIFDTDDLRDRAYDVLIGTQLTWENI